MGQAVDPDRQLKQVKLSAQTPPLAAVVSRKTRCGGGCDIGPSWCTKHPSSSAQTVAQEILTHFAAFALRYLDRPVPYLTY
ncbi:hypothetical protein SCP_1500750 [Sparassis crispa]|uniref:Uncharacterized protein n=1 Tax=Sparassis crispa TaxID=139825 RepID=A0A401H3T4_9APHY|nr:hypothetical protein SCP_1500750 [Sparassis crispa]GBE89072.1 hypothetical protein SCP_1500750 [Sparassis crispa]